MMEREDFRETVRRVRTFDDAERAIRCGLNIVSFMKLEAEMAEAA